MGLTATAHSVPGSLRQEVVIDGRHRLTTDEPERLGGGDSGPAPHELLPAALAACVATTLVMYARTKGWDPGPIDVDVDYDSRALPPRCRVTVELGGVLSGEQLLRLGKAARTCPVRRSLEGGVRFEESIVARAEGGDRERGVA